MGQCAKGGVLFPAMIRSMKILCIAIATLGLSTLGASAFAGPFSTEPDGNELVGVELVLEEGALTPGRTAHLGVMFHIEPDWHIYWRNAGDTGLPPSIKLELPDGVSAGEVQWPVPTWYEHAGLLDFVFDEEVTLIIPLSVAPDFKADRVNINAAIDWLVCKESCLPGGANVSINVPVGEPLNSSHAAASFEATRIRLPQPPANAATAGIIMSWDGRRLQIDVPRAQRIRFFSYEPAKAPPVEPIRDAQSQGAPLHIEYDSRIDNAAQVAGVLEVQRVGVIEFFTVTIPGPRK